MSEKIPVDGEEQPEILAAIAKNRPAPTTGVAGAVSAVQTGNFELLSLLGGWWGIFEAVAPPLAFLILFLSTQSLPISLAVAVSISLISAAARLIRRQSLQQAAIGLCGILISAGVAWFTDSSSGFFLPGIIINIGYGVVILATAAVRYPLVGIFWWLITQDSAWRKNQLVMRACMKVTVIVGAAYLVRGLISLPLFLADWTGILGGFRVLTGIPLTALLAYIAWVALKDLPWRFGGDGRDEDRG